jgi:hypothetical protein
VYTWTVELKFSDHCNKVNAKSSSRSCQILQCFRTRDVTVLVRAYTTFVRPVLEYASVVWSPHFIKDVRLLERVQRNFTKRLSGMRNLTYAEIQTGLESLQDRRVKADLLMCYKIIHGLLDVQSRDFL